MNNKENRTINTARIAGIIYITYIIMHVLADLVGRATLIVYEDARATAHNIMNSGWQFQLGFITDLSGAVLFLLAAWALYVLLKPVSKNIALLFLLLNLGGVTVQCFSNIFLIAGQLLINGPEYLTPFTTDQLQAQALFFLHLHKNGFMIAQIFYGAWLFPLGFVVYKSVFLPRLFGILLMVHSVFWLITFLQFFLFPEFHALTYVSYPIGFIAEAGLGVWLIIVGVRNQNQR